MEAFVGAGFSKGSDAFALASRFFEEPLAEVFSFFAAGTCFLELGDKDFLVKLVIPSRFQALCLSAFLVGFWKMQR